MAKRFIDCEDTTQRRAWPTQDGWAYRRVYSVPPDCSEIIPVLGTIMPGDQAVLPGGTSDTRTGADGPRLQSITPEAKSKSGTNNTIVAVYESITVTESTRSGTYVETAKSPKRRIGDNARHWTVYGLDTSASGANQPAVGDIRSSFGTRAVCIGKHVDPEWQHGRVLVVTTWREAVAWG